MIIPKTQEDENNHEIVCRIHENRFTSREEANAALIAAAPEMYYWLRDTVAALRRIYCTIELEQKMSAKLYELIYRGEEIQKKARGEQ